jgi:hypothetical protein
MSGHGGGGGAGGGGGEIGGIDCAKFVKELDVISADIEVLEALALKAIGRIELGAKPGEAVQVVFKAGVLGHLSFTGVGQLKECLRKGFKYRATLMSKTKVSARVDVRPAN